MIKAYVDREVGNIILQQIDYFINNTYYFVSTDGRICHVPYRLRSLVKEGDHVICRMCEYKRNKEFNDWEPMRFDGEKYYCYSVQGYGTEEEMLKCWNADNELEKEMQNFIEREISKMRMERQAKRNS